MRKDGKDGGMILANINEDIFWDSNRENVRMKYEDFAIKRGKVEEFILNDIEFFS